MQLWKPGMGKNQTRRHGGGRQAGAGQAGAGQAGAGWWVVGGGCDCGRGAVLGYDGAESDGFFFGLRGG